MQAWDRYAYVNNNPVRYTDPTGHICKDGDENIWGYCELPSPDKVKNYQTAYLNAVARKYGIRLSPGDRWKYIEYVTFNNGDASDLGWTPYQDNDPYLDESGDMHYAEDRSVVITQRGFNDCGTETLCVAGIMAHEATHSWIEGKIEHTSTTGEPRISNHTLAEEVAADLVAMQLGDPKGLLMQHHSDYSSRCQNTLNSPCLDPIGMLENFYEINLSDISDLVFGK